MPMLSSVTYVPSASALENSHITDLILHDLDGTQVLYATTRLDGVISAWSVAGTDLSQIGSAAYDLAATVGGRPGLVVINDALLTAGAAGQMALRPSDRIRADRHPCIPWRRDNIFGCLWDS